MNTIKVKDASGIDKHYLVTGDGTEANPFKGLVDDLNQEIALGNIDGSSFDTKYGGLSDMDAADGTQTVWRLADDNITGKVSRKTFQTTAATLYIASSNASDTSIDIDVIYHDSSNNEQSITVTLNGQTPVSLGVSGLDCNRMSVSSSDDTLAGDVYLTNENNFTSGVPNDSTKILAFILAESGQTEQCTYRVPDSKTKIIKRFHASISRASGAAGSAKLQLFVKNNNGSWLRKREYPITTEKVINLDNIHFVLNSNSLMEWVITDVSDSDTSIYIEYDYILKDV